MSIYQMPGGATRCIRCDRKIDAPSRRAITAWGDVCMACDYHASGRAALDRAETCAAISEQGARMMEADANRFL